MLFSAVALLSTVWFDWYACLFTSSIDVSSNTRDVIGSFVLEYAA